MATELGALVQERLTDTVYGLIRERILSGAFAPGEKLNVDQLAEQLNISPTPVKSALALLAVEGLVTVQPRRGTFVASISQEDLSEVLVIRVALEALAADTLLQHITPQDITALKAMARQIADAADVDEHTRLNAEFHHRLVELSGNRKLLDLYRQLHAHIHIALVHSHSRTWRERAAAEAAEHDAIIAAIERGDAAAVKDALTRHLTRSRSSLLSDISSQAQPDPRP